MRWFAHKHSLFFTWVSGITSHWVSLQRKILVSD